MGSGLMGKLGHAWVAAWVGALLHWVVMWRWCGGGGGGRVSYIDKPNTLHMLLLCTLFHGPQLLSFSSNTQSYFAQLERRMFRRKTSAILQLTKVVHASSSNNVSKTVLVLSTNFLILS